MVEAINKQAISDAISKVEQKTSGEIHVHIRQKCQDNAQIDAEKLFMKLGMDKTRDHNAILIFIGMTSKRFAIIGDTGIHEKIGDHFWMKARDAMQNHFKIGEFTQGILLAIDLLGAELITHFPDKNSNDHELADEATFD